MWEGLVIARLPPSCTCMGKGVALWRTRAELKPRRAPAGGATQAALSHARTLGLRGAVTPGGGGERNDSSKPLHAGWRATAVHGWPGVARGCDSSHGAVVMVKFGESLILVVFLQREPGEPIRTVSL